MLGNGQPSAGGLGLPMGPTGGGPAPTQPMVQAPSMGIGMFGGMDMGAGAGMGMAGNGGAGMGIGGMPADLLMGGGGSAMAAPALSYGSSAQFGAMPMGAQPTEATRGLSNREAIGGGVTSGGYGSTSSFF